MELFSVVAHARDSPPHPPHVLNRSPQKLVNSSHNHTPATLSPLKGTSMELFSTRLALRPWADADAPALFELARDPRVGTAAGWPPHTGEEQSLDILRNVLHVLNRSPQKLVNSSHNHTPATLSTLKGTSMELFSTRLALRPWVDADAPALYELARDPLVGTAAGWPPPTSEEQSLDILRNVLQGPEQYAITLRESGELIGAIGLLTGDACDYLDADDEYSVGYWIGVPYWGQGFAAEALQRLIDHARDSLGARAMALPPRLFSASSTTLAIPWAPGPSTRTTSSRTPSHTASWRSAAFRLSVRKPLTSFIRQASVTCSSCGASLFRISKGMT